MVTASDLSLQFQSLAEPFLLLREIELHVRQLLGDKITIADFELLAAALTPFKSLTKMSMISHSATTFDYFSIRRFGQNST